MDVLHSSSLPRPSARAEPWEATLGFLRKAHRHSARSRPKRAMAGGALAVLAASICLLLEPQPGWGSTLAGFIPLLALATWSGGRAAGWSGAGVSTTLTGWLAYHYPGGPFGPHEPALIVATFGLGGAVTVLLTDAHSRTLIACEDARSELERTRSELETRVQERTARLEELAAQMEVFSYSVSHDLRSPVRAISGFAEALREDHGEELSPAGRQLLDRIIRGGQRMNRLINDVLAYSRVNRSQLAGADLSLEDILRLVIHESPELQPPRAEVQIAGPLLPVHGTEVPLTLVVANLLGNAAKFVAPDTTPRIVIRTEARGSRVRLWVEDNGIGIPPEQQGRLFGLFERLHPVGRYEGTGMGLAIVRRAAERMGGAAGVESDGRTGSRFWVELPAARDAAGVHRAA